MKGSLVILLHGVGSNGADIGGLAHHWGDRLKDTSFAAPDGPRPFDKGGAGRQWFSVEGVTPANRAERIEAARPEFDRVLSGILERHSMTDRLDQVALVGFSQGSIMALDAVVSGRWPVRAVLALSGRLASPGPFAPAGANTQILLVNGTADPIMPIAEARLAEQQLAEAGYRVQLKVVEGLGHTISQAVADQGLAFLTNALD